MLLTSNQMIFLVQFEINTKSSRFSKTTNITRISLARAYLFQITLEIIL